MEPIKFMIPIKDKILPHYLYEDKIINSKQYDKLRDKFPSPDKVRPHILKHRNNGLLQPDEFLHIFVHSKSPNNPNGKINFERSRKIKPTRYPEHPDYNKVVN